MIVEVRTYKIKPGRRDEFIEFFETRGVPAQRALGMKILGPLLDIEADCVPKAVSHFIIERQHTRRRGG